MCKTIVITTTEQAEAMLEHLDACREYAKKDDYASQRAKPIKSLRCTCCGETYRGRQWWNQDCGHGLGDCCVAKCGADPAPGAYSDCYGVSGIHFLIGNVFERAKQGGAVICTEEDYDEALGSMPPATYLRNGFVLGEPYDADRWYCFWKFDGKCWCMLTTLAEARAIVHINARGITYQPSQEAR